METVCWNCGHALVFVEEANLEDVTGDHGTMARLICPECHADVVYQIFEEGDIE